MSRKPWVLSCRNNRCDITQRSLLVCGNVALQGCMKNVVLPTSGTVFKSPSKRLVLSPFPGLFLYTLQGINMSHLGKRKIIFKMPFLGDMLVPWTGVRSCPFHLHALDVVQLHLTYPHPLSQLGTGRGDFDRRLSDRSWWFCTTVGARLRQEGVDLVALDD